MIIYLEGVDGSGKTTLKEALTKRLTQLEPIRGVKVYPEGESLIPTRPSDPNRLNALELVTKLYDMATDPGMIYICDRGPISDIIYRAFDEHHPIMPLEAFWTWWLGNQQVIVIVHCDTNRSEQLMKDRGDNNPTAINHHKSLRYLYKQIMPIFRPVKYDIETSDLLTTTTQILATLWTHSREYREVRGLSKKEN